MLKMCSRNDSRFEWSMWPYFLGSPFPISFLEVRHYENSRLHYNLGSYQDIVGSDVPNKLFSLKRKSRMFFNGYEKIPHQRLMGKKVKERPLFIVFSLFLIWEVTKHPFWVTFIINHTWMHMIVKWTLNHDKINWTKLHDQAFEGERWGCGWMRVNRIDFLSSTRRPNWAYETKERSHFMCDYFIRMGVTTL
mgnify:CR=1 FL=1